MKRSAISLACVAAALALVAPLPALAATSSPSDYFFSAHEQWGLSGAVASINAPAAWCASTGAGVIIADVDSGAHMAHVDLKGKLIPGAAFLGGNGAQSSATGDAAAVEDDNGHGTETAGVMAADTDNGYGIAGVAPDARVLVVKVLQNDPNTGNATGSDSDVATGIRYAADYPGVKVINLSIGPEVPLVLQATGASDIPGAIQYAYSKGVAVAVAAGNNSSPAGNEYKVGSSALVVGALGPAGEVAYYSNTSRLGASASAVQIYAPGGDDLDTTQSAGPDNVGPYIVSTYLRYQSSDNAYSLNNEGTSFAAPHVAGALALLMSTGMSNQAAMQRLVSTAASRNGGGTSGTVKELDAAAALGVAPSTTCGGASTTKPIPPGGEGGGTHGNAPAPARTQPPAQRTAPPAPHSTAIALAPATPPATTAPTPPPLSTDVGATPPAAIAISGRGGGGGSSGGPSPLLLAGLAILIVLGAPAAAAVTVRLRRARNRT